MLIAAIIAVCVLLFVLGVIAPRLSQRPQRGVSRALGGGQREASKAPGQLGRWLQKPFSNSRRATSESASAGRKVRRRMPL
jgi:uncharacterized protein DUF6411